MILARSESYKKSMDRIPKNGEIWIVDAEVGSTTIDAVYTVSNDWLYVHAHRRKYTSYEFRIINYKKYLQDANKN